MSYDTRFFVSEISNRETATEIQKVHVKASYHIWERDNNTEKEESHRAAFVLLVFQKRE